MAENCWVPPVGSEALAGVTLTIVRTAGEGAAVEMLPRPVGPSQPAPAVHFTDGLHVPFDPDVTSKYGVVDAQAY